MKRTARGFTLIEVALAILVVALGVLAVFGLLSSGADASARAAGETHGAMFAENVLNGLRSKSMKSAEATAPGGFDYWESFWFLWTNRSIPITVAPSGLAWTNDPLYSTSFPLVVFSGGPYTQVFRNISYHDASVSNIPNHSLRYLSSTRMASRVATNTPTATFSGILYASTNVMTTRVAQVTLLLWDGEYGTTNADEAQIFYSEYDNPGNL